MEVGVLQPSPGDPKLIDEVVNLLKSQGVFDNLRKECLADVDTKPAYQNLTQRVESYVAKFLEEQKWSPDLNKNQLRDGLRKQINQSGMLANGVDRVIDQVIQPKIYKVFKPEIDKVMCDVLGLDPKQREENEKKRQELLIKYQQQQSFMQKNGQHQQQGFQGQMGQQQQQFFQGNVGTIRPQGVPNTNFPPPMMPPQGFNQFQNQQGMQTIQTPRGPLPLMQINTLAAQQGFINMPQNYNQANIQQTFQANLLLAQQQALVRAGLQSMGMAVPQQNIMQPGIMQQAGMPGVPGMQMNQFNPQLALATSKAQQLALQTSQAQKIALQTSSQTQFGLPRPVISSAFTLPSTSAAMLSNFSPMTTSSPRAPKPPGVMPGTPATTAGMTPGTPSLTTASPAPSQSPALPTTPPPPLPDSAIKTEKPRTPEPASPKDSFKKDSKDALKSKEKPEKKSKPQLPFAVKERSKHRKDGSLSRESPQLDKMKRLKDRASPSLDKVKREDSSRESSPKLKHLREGSSSRDSPKSDSSKLKSKSDKYKDIAREPLRSDKLGHEIKMKKEGLKVPLTEKQKQKEDRLRILGEKVERKLQQKLEIREKFKEKERLTSGKVKIGDRILGPKVPSVVPLPAEGKVMIGDRVLGPKIPAEEKLKLKSLSDRDRLKFIEKQKIGSGEKLYSSGAERLKESERKMLGDRSLDKHKMGDKYKSKLKHGEKIKGEFPDRVQMSSVDRKGDKLRMSGEKHKSFDPDNVKASGSMKSGDMFNKPGFKKTKPVLDIKREHVDGESRRPKEIPLEKVRPGEDPRLKDIYWGREERHPADPRSASKERRKTVEGLERSKHSSKDLHGERRKNIDAPEFLERRHSKSLKDTREKKRKSSKKLEKAPEKKYEFAWNKIKSDQLSDVSVSSVHTSDLSSFEYDLSDFETDASEVNKRKKEAGLPIKREASVIKEPPAVTQPLGDDYEPLSESEDEGVYKEESPLPEPPKPAKKADSQRERDRQRRRAEIEAKLRELDDRKRQLQAECRKLKQAEKANVKEGKVKAEIIVKREDAAEAKRQAPQSPLKKTKQELKEHLREQKVFEKKMALRRQRAPNKRYTSDEFTSIFSEGQKFYKENRKGGLTSTSGSSSRSRSATPTQDEQLYLPPGKAIAKTEQNIPIYDVTTPQKGSSGNLGRLFRGGTRSPVTPLSLNDDDYYEKISSGDSILNSPNSDISEAKSDDFLDDSPEKVDKKHKSASPIISPIDSTERPMSKTPPLSAARSTASRYDLSDLYKPRTSHRRGSPIRTAAEDVPPSKMIKEEPQKVQAKEEKLHKEKKKQAEKYSPPAKSDAVKLKQKRNEAHDINKPRLTFLSSGRRRNVSGRAKGDPDMASASEKELIEAHRVFTSKHSRDKSKGKKRLRSLSPLAWTNSLLARPSNVKQSAKGRPRKRAKLAPPSREETPEPASHVVRRRATSPLESISRPSTPELTIDEQAESMAGSIDSRSSTPMFRPKSPPGEPPKSPPGELPEDDQPPTQRKNTGVAVKISDVVALLRKEEAELVSLTSHDDAGMSPRSDASTPTMDEPAPVLESMEVDQFTSSFEQVEQKVVDDRESSSKVDLPSPSGLTDVSETSSPRPTEFTSLVLEKNSTGMDTDESRFDSNVELEEGERKDLVGVVNQKTESEQMSGSRSKSTSRSGSEERNVKMSDNEDQMSSNTSSEESQSEAGHTASESHDGDLARTELCRVDHESPSQQLENSDQGPLSETVEEGNQDCLSDADHQKQEITGSEEEPQVAYEEPTEEPYENQALEDARSAVEQDLSKMEECPSALDILAASALSTAGSFTASTRGTGSSSTQEQPPTSDSMFGITLVDVSGKTEFCTVGDEPNSVISLSDQNEPEDQAAVTQSDTSKPTDDESSPAPEKSASPLPSPSQDRERMVSQSSDDDVMRSSPVLECQEESDSPDKGLHRSEADTATSDLPEQMIQETSDVEEPEEADTHGSDISASEMKPSTPEDDSRTSASVDEMEGQSNVDSLSQDSENKQDSSDLEDGDEDINTSNVIDEVSREEVDGTDSNVISEEEETEEPLVTAHASPHLVEEQSELETEEKSNIEQSSIETEETETVESGEESSETEQYVLKEGKDSLKAEEASIEATHSRIESDQDVLESHQDSLKTKEDMIETEQSLIETEDVEANEDTEQATFETDALKTEEEELLSKPEVLEPEQEVSGDQNKQNEPEDPETEQENTERVTSEAEEENTERVTSETEEENTERVTSEAEEESLDENEDTLDKPTQSLDTEKVADVSSDQCADQSTRESESAEDVKTASDSDEGATSTQLETPGDDAAFLRPEVKELLKQVDEDSDSKELEPSTATSPGQEECHTAELDNDNESEDDAASKPRDEPDQPDTSCQSAVPSSDLDRPRRSSRASIASEDPTSSPRSLSPRSESPSLRRSRRQSRASVASDDLTTSPTRSESPAIRSRPDTPSIMPHVGPPTPPVGGRSSSPSSSRTSTPTNETRRTGRPKRSDSQTDATISAPSLPRGRRASSPTVKRTSLRSYSPPPHYGTRRAGKGKPEKPEKKTPGAPAKKPKLSASTVSPPARTTRGQKPAAVAPQPRGRGKPTASTQSSSKSAPGKRGRGSKDEGPPSKRGKH